MRVGWGGHESGGVAPTGPALPAIAGNPRPGRRLERERRVGWREDGPCGCREGALEPRLHLGTLQWDPWDLTFLSALGVKSPVRKLAIPEGPGQSFSRRVCPQ